MRYLNAVIIASLLMLQYGCTPNSAGGISDHGNERVAGIVIDADGVPAAGVTVTLLPDEYNHITDSTRVIERKAVTDAEGHYEFNSLVEGTYAVRADDRSNGRAGVAKSVDVGDTDTVVGITLNVMGRIFFVGDSTIVKPGMMIFLPGIACYDSVGATREVNLIDIPPGRITLKAYDPATKKVVDLGRGFVALEVIPIGTLILPSISPAPYCLVGNTVVDTIHAYVGDTLTFSPVHPSKKIDGNFAYRFSWGNDAISGWSSDIRWKWSWDKPGYYFVQSQMMRQGQYFAWSEYIAVRIDVRE